MILLIVDPRSSGLTVSKLAHCSAPRVAVPSPGSSEAAAASLGFSFWRLGCAVAGSPAPRAGAVGVTDPHAPATPASNGCSVCDLRFGAPCAMTITSRPAHGQATTPRPKRLDSNAVLTRGGSCQIFPHDTSAFSTSLCTKISRHWEDCAIMRQIVAPRRSLPQRLRSGAASRSDLFAFANTVWSHRRRQHAGIAGRRKGGLPAPTQFSAGAPGPRLRENRPDRW